MRRTALSAGLFGSLALAGMAQAHTPYLSPNTFAPSRAYVTVQAGVADSYYFISDFPIRGEGDFWATGPSGTPVKAENLAVLKEYAAFDVATPTAGTYRISTGERAGRQAKWVKIDGAWKMVRPAGGPGGRGPGGGGASAAGGATAGGPPGGAAPAAPRPGGQGGPPGGASRFVEESAIPAGAETMTAVSYTRSETYVTKGAPSREALKPAGKGFELEAVTHPNEIYAGEAFKFRLLNDGKPVAGVAFEIQHAGDAYAEKKFANEGKTGADGTVSVTIAEPGVYVLETSYPVRTEGAPPEPVARSGAYILTFEVTK